MQRPRISMKSTPTGQLERILGGPTKIRLLRELLVNPDGGTVKIFSSKLHITKKTVHSQLKLLEKSGLVYSAIRNETSLGRSPKIYFLADTKFSYILKDLFQECMELKK